MKSGFETLRAVLLAVTEDGCLSRRDVAERLGISTVSVSKAVRTLSDLGLISTDGRLSTGGRSSELLCPAYNRRYLVINICDKPFSYAYAHLGEELSAKGLMPSVTFVPYLNDLDFSENLMVLARSVISHIKEKPTAVALAVSGDYDHGTGKISNTHFKDYLGDDIGALLSSFGLAPDIVLGTSEVLSASPTVRRSEKPCIYLSVAKSVRGIRFGDHVLELDWSGVRVDGMTVSDILRCGQGDACLADRLEKLIVSAAELLQARSVLLNTNTLPDEAVALLCERIDILQDVTYSAPILSGLLSLLGDMEIKKYLHDHFDAKK